MIKNRNYVILLAIIATCITSLSLAQEPNNNNPIGIFEDHHDWVAGMAPGEASYDPNTGEYVIIGSSALYIDEQNREIGMGGHVVGSWIKKDDNFELEAHVTAESCTGCGECMGISGNKRYAECGCSTGKILRRTSYGAEIV